MILIQDPIIWTYRLVSQIKVHISESTFKEVCASLITLASLTCIAGLASLDGQFLTVSIAWLKKLEKWNYLLAQINESLLKSLGP